MSPPLSIASLLHTLLNEFVPPYVAVPYQVPVFELARLRSSSVSSRLLEGSSWSVGTFGHGILHVSCLNRDTNNPCHYQRAHGVD